MRFDLPESITAMRAGTKTQTRRRSAYWLKKKPGDRITVVHQGETLGWARVFRVWQQRLVDMTEYAAIREGYASRADFLAAWQKLYGEPDLDEVVVAISFYDVHWREP